MKNVIKRSDLEYNIKDGWYCEVKKTLPPGGNKANEGEEIYIAQKGYAIYARGIISEIKRIEKNSLNEFVKTFTVCTGVGIGGGAPCRIFKRHFQHSFKHFGRHK